MEAASTSHWGPVVWMRAGQWAMDISVPIQYECKEFWPATFLACALKNVFSSVEFVLTDLQIGFLGFQLTLYSL